MQGLISIVIPVYNEAQGIVAHLNEIIRKASRSDYDLELILVNDGSSDETREVLSQFSSPLARVKQYHFTRNFGKEAAISAGLKHASGAAVIVMDSDLQHPPELIHTMINYWQQGFLVVEAVKKNRGKETYLRKKLSQLFYFLFYYFCQLRIQDYCDYKLLDKKVVQAYLAFPEKGKFFRGLISWAGYPSVHLPFEVPERQIGTSRWGSWRLVRYAIHNITSFSSFPLKLVTLLGGLTLLMGFILGSMSLVQKIQGHALAGFTTVNLLIIFTSGVLMISLGIIGHYLARIYEEIKGRPSYIIDPTVDVQKEFL